MGTRTGDQATDVGGSTLSLWSRGSLLSIGSTGSVLSIGSVGSVLSVGSLGSAGSFLSVGSWLSSASVLSSASNMSVLSHASHRAVLADHRAGGGQRTHHAPVLGLILAAGAACAVVPALATALATVALRGRRPARPLPRRRHGT